MKTGLIYRAYDSEGKSYVGQTMRGLEIRKNEHLTTSLQDDFHNALKSNDFNWEVLEDNIPAEQLLERERYWAKVYDSCKNGYNGQVINVINMTEETKRKISESKMGHTVSDETKIKISNTLKGRPVGNRRTNYVVSEETKQKISKATSGANNGMYGKKHSEESKKKMSLHMKGRIPWNKGKKSSNN